MFHTPPVDPKHTELTEEATLESYNLANDVGGLASVVPPLGSSSRSASSSSSTRFEKASGQAAQKFSLEYTRKVKSIQLPKPIYKLIDEFLQDLQAPKYAQPLSTDQVGLLFQQFYGKFEEASKHYVTKNYTVDDYLQNAEFILCANKMIYAKIFQNNVDDLKTQINIYKKVYVLRQIVKIQLLQLDFDLKLFGDQFDEEQFKNELSVIKRSFNISNLLKSPLEKLIVYNNSFELLIKLINQKASGQGINADAIIPIFIFFIVYQPVENLYLNFKYIRRFKYEKFWNSNGMYSYNFTNIEALLTFLIKLNYSRDLNLTDEMLKDMLEKRDKNPSFVEDHTEDQSGWSEKKKLILELDEFNSDKEYIGSLENLNLEELKQILSPLEDSVIIEPLPKLPPGRKKSNSITIIKNTFQESLAHYHAVSSPTSVLSSELTLTNKGILQDAAMASQGLVMNVADQGIKNLTTVFDSSLKFLGNRMALSTSIPTAAVNRSRSSSVNENLSTRSNSTVNESEGIETTHPLSKYIKWRSSNSGVNSPANSTYSIPTESTTDNHLQTSIETNKSHSRNGSLSLVNAIKKSSPKLPLLNLNSNTASPTTPVFDIKNHKRIEKNFNDLTVAELQELYTNYNRLVTLLEDRN